MKHQEARWRRVTGRQRRVTGRQRLWYVTEKRTRNDEMVGRDLHQISTNTQEDQKGHVSESDWI